VAPVNRDSGTLRGYRAIAGGRAEVRRARSMAILTAIRCHPAIQSFHRQLRERGKPAKVAITACMRKLLTIIDAMVRDAARHAAA
jgi:transposase